MEYLQTQSISLPRLGLGTFRMQGEVCRAAVESALALGYRHIDTAEMYGNEDAVGAAVAASGIARGDLHITTKVWHENLAPDAIRSAFDASLKKLKLDHVDLYLVHWPSKNMSLPSIFETLLKLKDEGRTPIASAFDASLKKLKLDHVDLYLVHWPSKNMSLPSIFETLLKLKDEGRTRAIGVANFN